METTLSSVRPTSLVAHRTSTRSARSASASASSRRASPRCPASAASSSRGGPTSRAQRALERACGRPPVVVRSGGSIPVLSAFAARGIPTIVGGFALVSDSIHAPDESYRIASLELGLKAARALYEELGALR